MAFGLIKAIGLGLLFKKVTGLQNIVTNKERLNRRMGIAVVNEIERTFKVRGAGQPYQGETWPELSSVTLDRRSRRGIRGTGILTATRRLRRSFKPKATESRFQVTRDTVTIGTNVPYAEHHEFPTRLKKRGMLPTQERALEVAVKEGKRFVKQRVNTVMGFNAIDFTGGID